MGLRASVHWRSVQPDNEALTDLSWRETLIFVPLVALIIVLGVYPKIALDVIEPSTEAVLDRIEATTDFEIPQPGRFADIVSGGHE